MLNKDSNYLAKGENYVVIFVLVLAAIYICWPHSHYNSFIVSINYLLGLFLVVTCPLYASERMRATKNEKIKKVLDGFGRLVLPLFFSIFISYKLAEAKDRPIYFLAFVALWIGALHLTEFKEAQSDLNETTKKLGQLTGETDTLLERTNALMNLWGFIKYRQELHKAYQAAGVRILSVADYWSIDDEWWLSTKEWEKCPLFLNLTKGYADGKNPSQTIFVGKMPWPRLNSNNHIELEPHEFQRIVGLTWRLVIAAKVRQKKDESGKGKVRVLVGSVPVTATVVDNRVFTLLVSEADEKASRGTEITSPHHHLMQKEPADAYERMIQRYLRHARSGREYVISLIRLAAIATELNYNRTPIGDAEQCKVMNDLYQCLKTLGIDQWADKTRDWSNSLRDTTHQVPDKAALQEACIVLFTEFLKCYVAKHYSENENKVYELTFQDLRDQIR